ncbi:LacI family DNA-binding transcriptional regulator [uncultured Victivallis sp.]|uniref:LacI family DNA-binding transcriptional regulator n=1 Tax=uncultured Victivallis sp. TaxID=354118 RepID=UPI0025FBF064|nr:LacI family DNA-binding transcriptional regulator [uncultured Victivallis sp.]
MGVTITELARELNISHSTVSRVLNGRIKGRVHPEIANRIFALARERGYAPNPHARCLKTGRSGIIGLVVGEISERYSGCYAQALLNEAERYGLRLIISTTNYGRERERKCLEDLLHFHVDGVIYPLYFDPASPLYQKLKECRFPLLNFGNGDFSSVNYDYTAAFEAMFREFRKRGHARVTLLTWPYDRQAALFQRRAEANGFEVDTMEFDSDNRHDGKALEEVLRRGCSALYTNSYVKLAGLLELYRRRGATAPDCACTYTLPFEYLSDPAVIGMIHAPLRERVENEIGLLRLLIEDSARERKVRLLPTCFLSRPELETLRSKQCQDIWYRNYC